MSIFETMTLLTYDDNYCKYLFYIRYEEIHFHTFTFTLLVWKVTLEGKKKLIVIQCHMPDSLGL